MYGADSIDIKFIKREELLERVSQIEILERYLGVQVQFKASIKNPMRNDKTAGCRFYVKNNRVRFVDYSKRFNEDCFGVVQYIRNCNFNDAIKDIAKQFNLYDKLMVQKYVPRKKEDLSEIESKTNDYLYDISTDENGNTVWRKGDKQYWRLLGLNSKILEGLGIFPLQHLFINGRIVYSYQLNDVGFIYLFEDGSFKCYFPMRDKGRTKFINTSQTLQGYTHLPEQGDILVITKSMKDIACLKLFDIPAVASQSENIDINDDILDDLESRFETIVTLYDFDRVGVSAANKLYKSRGYTYLFFTTGKFKTKGYRAKDFAEYLMNNGKNKTLELIKDTYNEII